MAYAFMKILLIRDRLDIEAGQKDIYEFVISASKGRFEFEEIKTWIIDNLKK